jgi:2-methylcitrate synthase
MTIEKKEGLENIVAGKSHICLLDPIHEELLYRGYSIQELVKKASFEEVAYLLLRGEKPTKEDLVHYREKLKNLRIIPEKFIPLLEQVPNDVHPMESLRSAVSLFGNFTPDAHASFYLQDRLFAALPNLVLKTGKKSDEDTYSQHFLTILHDKKPTDQQAKALDVALILYAEHEFNASTFTVRTIASTLSDYFSAITGGIGALRGLLHGGANEAAYDLITRFDHPNDAEQKVMDMIHNKKLVMGFGHRVYKHKDPRSEIIKQVAKELGETQEDFYLFEIAERVEQTMQEQKKLFPNLDFYSALVFHWLGIPKELFTPLFVMSRVTGWSAHFLEQQENNRLIRPISEYVGPSKRTWNV